VILQKASIGDCASVMWVRQVILPTAEKLTNMQLKQTCLPAALTLLLSAVVASAQNHTVTSPGFFFNIDGNATQNPTISMQVGSTNVLTINTTPSFHPVVISSSPNALLANRYAGATPQNISTGTMNVTIPSNGFPSVLYYVCSIHGFYGMIDIQGGPKPPPSQILSLNVTSNVVMTSTGTNSTWFFKPEFSSNLTTGAWTPIPNFTNTFANGTNTTTFNRLDPICGPSVYLRIRQQQH
jgi:hypothetical protein